jgi:hypothetical protein
MPAKKTKQIVLEASALNWGKGYWPSTSTINLGGQATPVYYVGPIEDPMGLISAMRYKTSDGRIVNVLNN